LGQLLAVGTLATATCSLISMNRATTFVVPAWISGLASAVFAIGFIVVEIRHQSPMLPLPLLRRRMLGPVSLVGLLHNVSIYGLFFVLSLAFQRLRGLSPLGTGTLFLPLTIALVIGTRIGAAVLRKFGPFYSLIWGHFVAAIGTLILAAFEPGFPPAILALPLIIIGIGGGITTPAMSLAVLDSVERTQGGLASGILNSARQAGGVIGVAVLGGLLGEPATQSGAELAKLVAAGVLFVASGVAFAASRGWPSGTTERVRLPQA
jgi:MFS transporter, DHA2 family, methylenomycin A resistance protein